MMKCLRCDRAVPADARFCPGCGTRLAPSGAERFASPHEYTPAHLAERILTSRSSLEGERKQVTVLFADLKGSMELLADRDPEEAEQLLDRVLEHMLEAVHRYEGTVNQVLGDGVMALFGAPLAHEDHAARACYAALRMQERITVVGDEVQRTLGIPLQIRVGLNSGEVVVRSIGSDLRMTYTAVGPTVHLAARMEQIAKPASILATAETLALAGPRVRARAIGPVPVKGFPLPVEVHEILGVAKVQSRVGALAGRGLSRFVGRERELAALQTAFDAARAGAGQAVAVVGEAGVGKSRLFHEFVRRCRQTGALVLETVAVSYGRALAHRPGTELLRRYFRLDDADDSRAVREKVAGKLVTLDPALEEAVPALLWQLGALRPESSFRRLDPDTRRRRVVEAAHRLVVRESQIQPVVLVFEDLQWADSETRAALDELVRHVPPGTLVLVNCRPDYDDQRRLLPAYRRLDIDALPAASATLLLSHLLGEDPTVEALKPVLVQRTRGNPLFLEECIRNLVETGALAGEPGGYRLVRPVAAVVVPATVRAVLEARIDRLPPERKRLLQAAAVVGEKVPASLVEAIADAPAHEVRRALGELTTTGFLEETTLFPEPEYAFRHSLIHDVAYEGLLHERRRQLHVRTMEALERLHAGALADQVERLAHHAFHGEVWDKALGYLHEAGLKALARLPGPEAAVLLERALECVGRLPSTPGARELAIDIRCELHNALLPLGEHERVLQLLREAEALAAAAGDERRRARALAFIANNRWHKGESAGAIETAELAVASAERLGELDLQVVSNFSMGGAVRALGQYRRAAAYLKRILSLADGPRERETFGLAGLASVLARGHLAWSLAELGDFAAATAFAEAAIRIALGAEHAYSTVHAHLGLGGTLLRQGRIGEAMGVLERGLAPCKDVPFLYPPLAADLAVAYALSGRVARALELGEDAVRRAERLGRRGRLSLLVTHLGEVNALAGRHEAAALAGRRALDLAREHRERGNEVHALRLLGAVAAERRPPDVEAARAHYGAALELAAELEMRPLGARCHLGLGRVARRMGDDVAAARHLDAATEVLRELDMVLWIDRLELDREDGLAF